MILVSLNAHNAETRKRSWAWTTGNRHLEHQEAIAREKTCKVHIRAVCNTDTFTPEDSTIFIKSGLAGARGRVQTVREGTGQGQ